MSANCEIGVVCGISTGYAYLEVLGKMLAVSSLILRECGLGPGALAVLAAALTTSTIHRLDVSSNPLSGSTWHSEWRSWYQLDTDLDGVVALSNCLSLTQIDELSVVSCGLGPMSLSIVSTALG